MKTSKTRWFKQEDWDMSLATPIDPQDVCPTCGVPKNIKDIHRVETYNKNMRVFYIMAVFVVIAFLVGYTAHNKEAQEDVEYTVHIHSLLS